MAKNQHPYECDECGVKKQPSNGWFLFLPNAGVVTISMWDDTLADNEGTKHLCGISCVLKVTGRELVKFYGEG